MIQCGISERVKDLRLGGISAAESYVSINSHLCIRTSVNHHLGTIRLDSMSSVNHSWYNVVLKVEQSLRMALFLANLFWQNVCVHQQTEMSESSR